MTTSPHTTLLLVDPTSVDGESALDLLSDDDRHVSVVVLLTGCASAALRDFSRGAGIDLSTAGWTYLEQVADRVAADGRTVEVVAAHGPDTAFELNALIAAGSAARVLLPASIERLDPSVVRRIAFEGDLRVAELAAAR